MIATMLMMMVVPASSDVGVALRIVASLDAVASIVAAVMMVMMEQKTLVENVGEREV